MGSTNWTKTALTKNNEISSITKSKEFAQEVLKAIENIEVDYEASVIKQRDYITFNHGMMDTFLKFIRHNNRISWDVYFYLVENYPLPVSSRADARDLIDLNYTDIIPHLNIPERFKQSKKRYYVRRALKRLAKYGLIEYTNPKK